MAWKSGVHAQHGTTLIESTWADVMFGDGLARLKDELTRLGLTFDWNPDRPVSDGRAKPMKHEDLARLVRTFMTHVKSNSWTAEDLERRLAADLARRNGFRTRLFLQVYWPIHAEWERRLAADRSVDFEDMLVQAVGHLEAGNIDAGYDLIMVDEFQDASRARARLVRGLVKAPGRFLLAVGDDWQSINRFAGADLSVMTDFEALFGRGHQLALTRARRAVLLISHPRRMSPFVIELLKDPHVTVTGSSDTPVEICPGCGQGTLVGRNGKFGPFLGCSTFPACKYTREVRQRATGTSSAARRKRR